MNNAMTAYVIIDTLLRENGIRPIREGIGGCWEKSLENGDIEQLPGWEICANAIEYRDEGVTFAWSFGLVEARENEADAIAQLKFGITIPLSGDDDFEYHPALTIKFCHSTGAWTVKLDNAGCAWESFREISKIAEQLGLRDGNRDDRSDRMFARELTEAEARAAIIMLARHVKEHHIG